MSQRRLSQFWFTWTNRGLFSAAGFGPRAATEDLRKFSRSDWDPILELCRVPSSHFDMIREAGGSLAVHDLPEVGRLALRRTVFGSAETRYFIHGLVDATATIDPFAVLASWTDRNLWKVSDDPAADQHLPYVALDTGNAAMAPSTESATLEIVDAASEMMNALLGRSTTTVAMGCADFRTALRSVMARCPRSVRSHVTFDDALGSSARVTIGNSIELAGVSDAAERPALGELTRAAVAATPGRYERHSHSSWVRWLQIEQYDAAELLAIVDRLEVEELEWVLARSDVRAWLASSGPADVPQLLELRRLTDGPSKDNIAQALQRIAERLFGDLITYIANGKLEVAAATVTEIVAASPSSVDQTARQLRQENDEVTRLATLAVAARGGISGAGIEPKHLTFRWSLLPCVAALLPAQLAGVVAAASIRGGDCDAPELLGAVVTSDQVLGDVLSGLGNDGPDGGLRARRLLAFATQRDLVGDLTVRALCGWGDDALIELLSRAPLRLNAGQWHDVAARVAGSRVPWLGAGPTGERRDETSAQLPVVR